MSISGFYFEFNKHIYLIRPVSKQPGHQESGPAGQKRSQDKDQTYGHFSESC